MAMGNPAIQIVHSIQRIVCTGCGAEANASCNCGKPYVPKAARAADAVRANPEKSDRAIAAEIGVSPMTVNRARATVPDVTVDERIGLDGKTRRVPEKKPGPEAETVGWVKHQEIWDAHRRELLERIAKLETRIRELEDKLSLARMATGKPPDTAEELVAQRRVAEEVRKAERAAAKAARLAPGEEPVVLDPAARHLQRRANSASFTEKTKIVKALTEQTTSAEARHAGLQAWNALRTNKSGGKRKRDDPTAA
jgi:hypothetical protein